MLIDSFCALRDYCEREDYKGWDPYDGLNSRLFQALPLLKRSALCRLVVIQGFKRCPVNLRPLAWVPKEYNAKGIGLFLQGYCNLVRVVSVRPELEALLGHKDELLQKVDYLANLLISLQSKGIAVLVGDIISTGRRGACFCFPSLRLQSWRRIFAPQR